jgi:hypothetical protein
LLIRKDRAIAWEILNTAKATRKRLDQYIGSIAELERQAGAPLPVANWMKKEMSKT